jgi:hypothetical protein
LTTIWMASLINTVSRRPGITPATTITPDKTRNSEAARLLSCAGRAGKSAVIVTRIDRGA